jgi:hypothetical protein
VIATTKSTQHKLQTLSGMLRDAKPLGGLFSTMKGVWKNELPEVITADDRNGIGFLALGWV